MQDVCKTSCIVFAEIIEKEKQKNLIMLICFPVSCVKVHRLRIWNEMEIIAIFEALQGVVDVEKSVDDVHNPS